MNINDAMRRIFFTPPYRTETGRTSTKKFEKMTYFEYNPGPRGERACSRHSEKLEPAQVADLP